MRAAFAVLVLAACGGGDGDAGIDAGPGAATVSIEFENNTPVASLWHAYTGNETPDQFAVVLLGVTLDGAGTGSQLVYRHPACAGASLRD